MIVAVDTFSRPDGPLALAESGQPWETSGSGVWSVAGSVATETSGVTSRSLATLATGAGAARITATTDGADRWGLCVGALVAQNWHFRRAGTVAELRQVTVTPEGTVVDTQEGTVALPAAGTRVGLEADGAELRVYYGGALVMRHVHTAPISTPGTLGLFTRGAPVPPTWKDVVIEALPPPWLAVKGASTSEPRRVYRWSAAGWTLTPALGG